MHSERILAMHFSPAPLHPGFKVFSLVEFIAPPCATPGFALTQKVIRITLFSITKEITMKIKSLFLLVALGLNQGPDHGSGPGRP
ncbi:hypothetical protein LZ640_12115, partial [Aeromonas media]|uniref:hypothetical protein n=1 Tax=Aeromonas media TaxID=651 RepID=UPI001F3CF3A8